MDILKYFRESLRIRDNESTVSLLLGFHEAFCKKQQKSDNLTIVCTVSQMEPSPDKSNPNFWNLHLSSVLEHCTESHLKCFVFLAERKYTYLELRLKLYL